MLEEIDADAFASASGDLRDREAELKLEIDMADQGRGEIIDIAVKAFELSQRLREKWVMADYAARRRLLQILCLNGSLEGASLVPTMRKPFSLLAEGLLQKDSRGDCRRFEPWTPARDVYATSFFTPRPWYLSELAAIVDEVA